jgi:hypothetical protein
MKLVCFGFLFLALFSSPIFAAQTAAAQTKTQSNLRCGDRISGTVRLTADLDCTTANVQNALIIDGPTRFEGADFSIHQPEGGTAIFIDKADDVSIRNVRLRAAVGVFAFDSDKLAIDEVAVVDGELGFTIYAQERTLSDIALSNSVVRGARTAGVKIQSGGRGKILAPKLSGLVIQSEGFGLIVGSETLSLDADSRLDLSGSSSGLYFSGRHLSMTGLDWSRTPIHRGVIHAHRAARVDIKDCNFSSAPMERQEPRDQVGVHLDQIGHSEIRGVTVTGREVGIVLTTVRNVFARADIRESVLTGNRTAGVWIQSQDGSPFGRVRVMQNDLQGYSASPSGAKAIFRHGDTELGAGSTLTENRF